MKNNCTFLEKLLDGAEVEWKPLNKIVTTITAPVKLKREMYCSTGSTPIIDQGEKFIAGYTDENFEAIPSNEYIIFGDHSEHIKYVNFSFIQGADGLKILKPKEDNAKYIYYAFQNFYVKELNYKRHWSSAKETLIPLPPPTVQTEIVRILDALTALTSELTLRQKQYQYYREKLLSEEELGKVGFEWKTLEELVEKTQNIRWKNNTKTYRYIDLTSVDREYNNIIDTIEINALNAPSRAQKIVKENDIIFATTRPTQQRIASITKEFSGEIASTGYCVLRANTNIVLPKWLFYFLSTINFKNYVEQNQSGSAYPAISDSKVKEFRIPVPEVTVQQNIIEKLDKFYSLTNSLLHGLPKEINNRTKQYSYYQNELLNF